jgi:hypothetical protein
MVARGAGFASTLRIAFWLDQLPLSGLLSTSTGVLFLASPIANEGVTPTAAIACGAASL